MSEKMSTLREEKEEGESQVEELETKLAELRRQMVEVSCCEPQAGPSKAEQGLQAESEELQRDMVHLAGQLHA